MKPLVLMITLVVLCVLAGGAYLLWAGTVTHSRNRASNESGVDDQLEARNKALKAEEERLKAENEALRKSMGQAGDPAEARIPPEPGENIPPVPEMTSREQAMQAFQGEDAAAARKALEYLLRLAKAGDAEARAFLVQMLSAKDERVRALAVEGIGNFFDPKDLPLLEIASRDGSPLAREAAATWISEYPPEYATNALLGMLNDDNPRVLQRAIEGLGELRDEAAKNALFRMTTHSDDDVAAEAAIALRNFGEYGEAEKVAPKWVDKAKEGDRGQRVHAIKKLGALRVESTKPALEALLKDSDPKVAREAQKAIRKIDIDIEKRSAGKPK